MSDLMNMAGLTASVKWSDVISKRKTAQEWIPVTERLPEKYQYVLVTYKGLDGRRLVVTTNWNPNTWIESNSIAWMPVPEPFKEVSE